jgi:hypothetical protein
LRTARETEWGRRYRFGDLAVEPDVKAAYRETVPLHSYDDIREDVLRVRKSEADVMWPGRFTDFAVSSGTASAGKIIPVSRATLLANKRFSMGMLYNYIAQTGDARCLRGRFLSLPGRVAEDPNFPGTWVGEVSGLLARHAPRFVSRFLQAVPNETLNLTSWEAKLNAIVEQTLAMDIRSVVMVPTWALVFFEQLLARYSRVTGRRADSIADVWPNFRLFFSGGVALSSYREILEEQTGPGTVDFMEAYGASEGFFAFQLHPDDRDMALHLDNGIYYEFLRLDDPGRRRYSIDEVEPGVRYQMYVSTASGLWAYGVGDVVRFTSILPPRLVVAGRTSEMIDKYGEAVFGDEARDALVAACEGSGARIVDYHIAPSLPNRKKLPTYQWLVEFERPPVDIRGFATYLDEHLQRVNRHYQIRREDRVFSAPEVVSLPKGTFYEWLRRSRLSVSAQSKVPRMSEERLVADQLLELSRPVVGAPK